MPDRIHDCIAELESTLDDKARHEFGNVERIMLRRSMELCNMDELPAVVGSPSGDRASGEMICETCGQEYFAHPLDWRIIGYGDVPFLNVLCDGRRVKL